MSQDETQLILGQLIIGIEVAVGFSALIAAVYGVGKWVKGQAIVHINPYMKDLNDKVNNIEKDGEKDRRELADRVRHLEERFDRLADNRETNRYARNDEGDINRTHRR